MLQGTLVSRFREKEQQSLLLKNIRKFVLKLEPEGLKVLCPFGDQIQS